jgi:hypothetical protein
MSLLAGSISGLTVFRPVTPVLHPFYAFSWTTLLGLRFLGALPRRTSDRQSHTS